MTDQFEGRQETTLRDFLNVIFARKWLIVTIVGVATLLVIYLNARQPLFFESSSRLLVRRGEQAKKPIPSRRRRLARRFAGRARDRRDGIARCAFQRLRNRVSSELRRRVLDRRFEFAQSHDDAHDDQRNNNRILDNGVSISSTRSIDVRALCRVRWAPVRHP